MAAAYRWQGEDLILQVRIQPRAAKNELVGCQGEALKIRITSPPVDGKANVQLVKFLAGIFKVPKSQIEILSGETGRDKRLKVVAPRRFPEFIKKNRPNTPV